MRENLVNSAVSFLSSPKVQTEDREKQITFLKKKGLDNEEIEEAFKRSMNNNEKTMLPTTDSLKSSQFIVNKPSLPPRLESFYQKPAQIVHYPSPLAPTTRLTTKQILGYSLLIGLGAYGVMVALLKLVMKFMSKVLYSISNYQGNRYKQNLKLLNQIHSKLNETGLKSIPYYYGATTIKESKFFELDKKLNHILIGVTAYKKQKNNTNPYTKLKNDIDQLKDMFITTPENALNNFYSGSTIFTNGQTNRYGIDGHMNQIVQNIKSEIRSTKGALLSKRNFPVSSTVLLPGSPINQSSVMTPPPSNNSINHGYTPRRKQSFRSDLAKDGAFLESPIADA